MDERYDTYCAVDPLFYDSVASASTRTTEFSAADRPVPPGWRREPSDDWFIYGPEGGDLPQQGWKVHLSACLDNADRILDAAWDYCVPRGLPFKFLRGPRMLLLRNAKYARRGSSGKFVTIYPRDEAELELVCKELDELLAGEPGPYILSDLRYGSGPVYLRYGGFAARYCLSPEGQVVPAIEDGSGTLVPDRRDPVFHLPDWVRLPDFLTPHLAARNATTTTGLPYQIERVIHFSNGGGLYVGRDTRTDARVVLKEARPHAGLDATGTDAVTRLDREARMLRRLAGVARIPRVHDEFGLADHRFLALEFVDGRPLNKLLVERYPLTDADATPADFADYTAWALRVHEQVERAIDAIHGRGVVYGDLHLFNIMIGPDDEVTLVDFEVAAPVDEPGRPGLRNQGFAAPRDRTGFAVDRYALACLKLALFLPLTPLVRLAPEKAAHLADVIASHFPVPRSAFDQAIAEIVGTPAEAAAPAGAPATVPAPTGRTADMTGPPAGTARPAGRLGAGFPAPDLDADPGRWPDLRGRLAAAILASATPDRDDRLFPGDIDQFRTGGLNLAYGAAGVLDTLAGTGAGRFPEHEQWLVKRALDAPSGSRCGLYDGLHGVAYALERLGRRQDALDVLDVCLNEPWEQLGPDLASGLSGVALNLAEFAARTGEPALRDAAQRAVELVTERLAADPDTDEPDNPDEPGGTQISGGRHPYAGLTRGRTGPALMYLRFHEVTGDPALLDRAGAALRHDLRRCLLRPDGALEVNEGWRSMPYLAHGSVGIGLVLDQYLRHRPDDDRLARAAAAIRRAARSPFYAQSGLFAGRAGIIAYLAARVAAEAGPAGSGPDRTEDRIELAAQVRRLGWHAMPYRGSVAFPGDQLLRLSMDLATGTAGTLLALGTALSPEPVTLPFLAPLTGATQLPSRPRG
ncbi:class III lanthionine synthetase LanKC [Solwaraspora sp. WMMD1047]|uniref:class III lanthionine synthetase LanKC n=1 Tax=Solwaraspora sp. WMMD1047 TaxID=3016102 RepID=UPI002416488C|nr:class III lanthionine synthetase LanKC [Solwaraspora sp. WMMD1047]MDG4831165.1 class III lanthionine synthetase LanKC [Solwaraspora sp. WMMD1047]